MGFTMTRYSVAAHIAAMDIANERRIRNMRNAKSKRRKWRVMSKEEVIGRLREDLAR